MRLVLVAVLAACGGGKSSMVAPVKPSASLSAKRVAVGEGVMVSARWEGRCFGTYDLGADTCRTSDNPGNKCGAPQSTPSEGPCDGELFDYELRCEPSCVLFGRSSHEQKDELITTDHAGTFRVFTRLYRFKGGEQRIENVLDVVDPEPNSITVTCVKTLTTPLEPAPCSEALGFTVEARANGAPYAVFTLAVDGQPLRAARVVSRDLIDTGYDLRVNGVYAIADAKRLHLGAGPLTISVGAATTTVDFDAAR